MKRYEGQVFDVLVEGFNPARGTLNGRSSHNKLTHFVGDLSLIGQTVPVRISKAFPATFRGELVLRNQDLIL